MLYLDLKLWFLPSCQEKHKRGSSGLEALAKESFDEPLAVVAKGPLVATLVYQDHVCHHLRYFCRWQIKLCLAGKQKDDADGREDDNRFGWRRTRFGSRNAEITSKMATKTMFILPPTTKDFG